MLMLSNTLLISIKIIVRVSFSRSTLFERVDKWNYEPRCNFNHKKHIYTLFTCCFIFTFYLLRKYKNIFAFLFASLFASLHFYLPSSSSPLLFCNHHHHLHFYLLCFFLLVCFFESLANLARTCDTLAGRQGSLFFLLHVGSILTYSNLCYSNPVLLQAIKPIFWCPCRGV